MDKLHLTLAFFNEISPEDVRQIVQRLEREAAREPMELKLRLGQIGVFPDFRNPSVLWIEVKCADDALTLLKRRIGSVIRERGLPFENRTFLPHVTIARFSKKKPPSPNLKCVSAPCDSPPAWGYFHGLKFYKSELQPSGSIYTLISDIRI